MTREHDNIGPSPVDATTPEIISSSLIGVHDETTASSGPPSNAASSRPSSSEINHKVLTPVSESGPSVDDRRQKGGGFSEGSNDTKELLVEEECCDEEAWFEGQVQEMVGLIMGDEESYGFTPALQGHHVNNIRIRGEMDNLPGQVQEENDWTDITPIESRQSTASNQLLQNNTTGLVELEPVDSSAPKKVGLERTGGEKNLLNQTRPPESSLPSAFDWPQLWRRILQKVLPGSIFVLIYHQPKAIVSILVTPVKKLERQAGSAKSKRVHFRLRKKSQTQRFQPLDRHSKIVKNWAFFICFPRIMDIFTFGFRLAFCDLFMRKLPEVWFVDLGCEVLILTNMFVELATVVPKNTYPGQTRAAASFPDIARVYFRHKAAPEWIPEILYHTTSLIFWVLPRTDYHLRNADTYRWIWLFSMLPRVTRNLIALNKYHTESVTDPNVITSVSSFQAGYIFIFIVLAAESIGCVYYFLARLEDPTGTGDVETWIWAFENQLPLYRDTGRHPSWSVQDGIDEMPERPIFTELLLSMYKGLCRVASLTYDPGIPNHPFEVILCMLTMFFSLYIVALVLGTVLVYVVRRDPMEVAHQERLEALQIFMNKKHISEDLYQAVIRYSEFQFKKNRQSMSSSDSSLLDLLSLSLRIEVARAFHGELMTKCSKIGRPFHRCSEPLFNELIIKLYTVHAMAGDQLVHRDEIPRELYFVSSGTVHMVDEHDQVVSVVRSDVPDTPPIVGEVPFFLGINYMNAIKASLDADAELQVLSRQASMELSLAFPEDYKIIQDNLWAQFGGPEKQTGEVDDSNLDTEKLMTKMRILESNDVRQMQRFNALSQAARSGDVDSLLRLSRQGVNLNHTDYDGEILLTTRLASKTLFLLCSTEPYCMSFPYSRIPNVPPPPPSVAPFRV